MNSRKTINELVKIEAERTKYALDKNEKAFLGTYRRHKEHNRNSGRFWDSKFLEKPGVNYVERDRNLTSLKWLESLIKPGMKILNIGCGDGKFESVIKTLPTDTEYCGLDFAKKSIDRLKTLYPRFKFITGDITRIHLRNKFNVICIFEVLEHISSTKTLKVLRKIRSFLVRGGFIMIAVPLNEPLLKMFPNNPNEHVRLYSKETLIMELELSGFRVLNVQEFIAFSNYYFCKKILSRFLLKSRWKPNDILVLAQKK